MATEVFINIKDLPELTEISNGDYILLETSTGTHIIDFKNFFLPATNTVITTSVIDNTNSLIVLSSIVNTNINSINTLSSQAILNTATLSTEIIDLDNTLSTKITAISTQITSLSTEIEKMSGTYVGKVQITIPSGGSYETGIPLPLNETVTSSDILITPANAYAARFPAYVVSVTNGAVKIAAPFVRYDLTSSNSVSATTINAEQNAIYNVMAIKSV